MSVRVSGTSKHLHAKPAPVVQSRLFMEVQPRPSPGSAPFAWDDTSTTMESANCQRYGMGRRVSVEGTTKGNSSVQTVLPCASTGNFLEVVGHQGTPKITDAPGVGRLTMAPKLVLEQRRSKGLTTYNPAAWNKELSRHSLLHKYPNLVNGIIHGFNLGIPTITRTYNPIQPWLLHLYMRLGCSPIRVIYPAGL